MLFNSKYKRRIAELERELTVAKREIKNKDRMIDFLVAALNRISPPEG